MRYRVIATDSVGSIGGLADDAEAALALADDLKRHGYQRIVILDEFDRVVSEEEISRVSNHPSRLDRST